MKSVLLPVLLWAVLLGGGASAALPTLPSISQVITAFMNAGAGNGNSLYAQTLEILVHSPGALETAIVKLFGELVSTLQNLGNPELEYSYGGSPPVYPTPQGPGTGSWEQAYSQARALVSKMTNEEKNGIVYGASNAEGCSGFTGSVSRLGFPGICLNDAESGVRTGAMVNGYPAQLHIGASWNRTLAYNRAYYIGQEFKAKGINVALGPVIGPLGRIAKGGRNWEGFSNDPYLAGALVNPTITGFQKSVIACAKHFITNEQETNRSPFLEGYFPDLLVQSVSSNLDDRTMHELYLWPFYEAVSAGLGSVMCSYNRVNNSYACQNSKMMNGLLKTELGFEGFVVSDWGAQHTGIASANAGLDVAMPNSQYFDNNQLVTAVKNGSVSQVRLNDMVTRTLAAWYRYAQFQTPGMDNYANVDAQNPAANPTIEQAAVEGHVLVKNVNNALPLSKPAVLSVFGYDADGGRNSSSDDPIAYQVGLTNTPNYTTGAPFTDVQLALFAVEAEPYGAAGPDVALAGTLITGGGSGAITPEMTVAPYDALVNQAAMDNTTLYADLFSQDPTVEPSSNACLVFINAQSAETWDRADLFDDYSDTLVTNVARQCSNTIVVIHNAGIRLVDAWIENENVTAVIFGHVPGQLSGSGLVEILYGNQSPSGRLPYTVGKAESDYGTLLNPTGPDAQNPMFPQSNFTEGLYIDYKHFIQQRITPRFPFGYGLTYSNFTYSAMQVKLNSTANKSQRPPGTPAKNTTVAPEGGVSSLYDVIATVTTKVKNVGKVQAAEVAQLYMGIPNGPPKVLRGFDKILINPGATVTYTFPLRRRDLSMWDATQQVWILQPGAYNAMVGKNVEDIQLQKQFTL